MTDLINEVLNYVAEVGDCEATDIAERFNISIETAEECIKMITYE